MTGHSLMIGAIVTSHASIFYHIAPTCVRNRPNVLITSQKSGCHQYTFRLKFRATPSCICMDPNSQILRFEPPRSASLCRRLRFFLSFIKVLDISFRRISLLEPSAIPFRQISFQPSTFSLRRLLRSTLFLSMLPLAGPPKSRFFSTASPSATTKQGNIAIPLISPLTLPACTPVLAIAAFVGTAGYSFLVPPLLLLLVYPPSSSCYIEIHAQFLLCSHLLHR